MGISVTGATCKGGFTGPKTRFHGGLAVINSTQTISQYEQTLLFLI
jgi:hypothetical protein